MLMSRPSKSTTSSSPTGSSSSSDESSEALYSVSSSLALALVLCPLADIADPERGIWGRKLSLFPEPRLPLLSEPRLPLLSAPRLAFSCRLTAAAAEEAAAEEGVLCFGPPDFPTIVGSMFWLRSCGWELCQNCSVGSQVSQPTGKETALQSECTLFFFFFFFIAYAFHFCQA